MSSDLREGQGEEKEPKKGSGEILRSEIEGGRIAIERPVGGPVFVAIIKNSQAIGGGMKPAWAGRERQLRDRG